MNPSPPKYGLRFLRWFCREDYLEEIEGNLIELFEAEYEKSEIRANRQFLAQVLLHFRPAYIRSFDRKNQLIPYDMYQNYFKIGWRNLKKHRFFSLINISGMTIGMCCVILIALYIQYETSYDRQHKKANRIYRVSQLQVGNELMGRDRFAFSSLPIAPTLMENYPGIQAAVSIKLDDVRFSKGENLFNERVLYASEQLFDVFTYPIIEGIGAEALKNPGSILLTESMAKKHFGNESPIGKTLISEYKEPLIVRGVIQDVPANQHFRFDCILSVKSHPYYEYSVSRWNQNSYHTYIVLPPDYDYSILDKKLEEMDKYFEAAYAHFPFRPRLFLQPLTEIHLYSHLNSEIEANGDIRYVYFSAAIALIILLLASINYMNLATARMNHRAREIGVRKVMGAQKKQVFAQLMVESLLITLSSFVLGIVLAYLLLPVYNQLLDQEILFNLSTNGLILGSILLISLLLSSLAGLYPALLSAAVNPVKALKGTFFQKRKENTLLRNSLVIGQFVVAIILAVSSVVVYKQLSYIQNKKLGFNKDQIIYVPYKNLDAINKSDLIRTELLKHPGIQKVSFSGSVPVHISHDNLINEWEGNDNNQELSIYTNYVDYDFLDLFEIELVEGRNFSPDFPTDSMNRYLLNETAVKTLGWKSAVGKSFKQGKVIGVVKDFHFHTLDRPIEPLWMTYYHKKNTFSGNISMRVSSDNLDQTIAHLHKTLKGLIPELIVEHHFMDESYLQMYSKEKRFGQIFNIFTTLALLIACIGLLGLVTHKVSQRTKEIGIRKVLGAGVWNIVKLLTSEFSKMIIVAIAIALPVSFFIANNWLEGFAYRIDMQWWYFGGVAIITMLIASITVSFQTLKAASTNPVECLRDE
ncbi:MAG: ABC transporter permease [Bacteroidetes bacterium]|nr:ABC transporter permease [Bacteroidota bacterium]